MIVDERFADDFFAAYRGRWDVPRLECWCTEGVEVVWSEPIPEVECGGCNQRLPMIPANNIARRRAGDTP